MPRTCRDVVEYFYASSGPVTVEVRPPTVPTPVPPTPPLPPAPPTEVLPPPPVEVRPPAPPRAEVAVRDYRYALAAVAAVIAAVVAYLLRKRRAS